jgi:RNA polymerase sigma factor (sigma-70 family)
MGLTDAELLEAYVTRRDELAFEVLLRRHGPMVMGVCRRVLRNEAEAEDAFQATFLVLVRKAATVRPRSKVGNWLHGVAHNTALKRKAMNVKRRAKEREAGRAARPQIAEEVWRRLQALLDTELLRLPGKFRIPLLLCELEGRSLKDAARELGCPQGTVATHLARGRALLARRLAGHGLTLSATMIAAAWSGDPAVAGVRPVLLASTLQAARLLTANRALAGVVSPTVAALVQGVLKGMLLTRLKWTAAVLAAILAIAGGLVYRSGAAWAGPANAGASAEQVPPSGTRGAQAPAAQETVSVDVVARYLRKKYPEEGDRSDGRLRLAPGTKVTELRSPVLRKHLPDTRFFLTTLKTDYLSYLEVPLLVSASVADGKVVFRECFSTLFTDVSADFLAQFRGLETRTADDRKALGEAIATLFTEVTEHSELRQGDFSEPRCHIELWHKANGEAHRWRTIYFEFDAGGRLRLVALSDG